MIVGLLRTWAVLFLALGLSKAEVELVNGTYHNLLVSFSPNLKSDDGAHLLQSMKDLLSNASRALHTAIGLRIANVTFLLPDSWSEEGLELESGVKKLPISVEDSDVFVRNVLDDPFGKGPLAMQFGGCGVPGAHITVPQDFLNAPEGFPKGQLLAREWLKYRYGVFDENGFTEDSVYPTFYSIPGMEEDIKVTDCTHEQVEYTFKDPDGNNCSLRTSPTGTCKIHPGEMSIENVNSSLMFFHEELPDVEQVCGKDHPHNDRSPNKQNILCSEKSIWNILEQSNDFKTPLPDEPEEYVDPEFRFVKNKKPRVALLFEDTNILSKKKKELLFAMRRFVYEVPEGSQLSVRMFSDDNYDESIRTLSELTGNRANIIPEALFQVPATGVCPLCSLEKAVADLLEGGDTDGTIILIVGSKSEKGELEDLVEKLQTTQLCLRVIALKDVEDSYAPLLSKLKCQVFVQVEDSENGTKTFDALYNAMTDILPRTYTDSPVEVVSLGIMSQESVIRIPANPLASDFTLWLQGSVANNMFDCSTDEGVTVDTVQVEKVFLSIFSLKSPDKNMVCKWKHDSIDTVSLAQVQMRAKPGEFVSGSVWIHDPTPKESKEQMPVVVYAKVNYGDYPVSNAAVRATVTDSEGNITAEFSLNDDGKGDPDITLNDGIYSRYFFNFNKEGLYHVSMEITDNEGKARVLKKGADRCCGSEVKAQEQLPVPSFSKTLQETSFHAVSSRPEQGYPPSRITDLRVGRYEPPTLLELIWTAPGGEVDTEKAQSYILKSFSDRREAIEKFETAGMMLKVTGMPLPHSRGEVETLSFVPHDHLSAESIHHLVAVAVGKTGLSGPVSNVLTVSVPEDTRTTDVETTTEDANVGKARGPDKKTIGIVLGALACVLVASVLVYLVVYFVRRKKRAQKKAEEGRKNGGAQTCPRNNIGLNSIPAEAIVQHHNEVVKAKSEHRDPPIFKEESLEKASSGVSREGSALDGGSDHPEYSQVSKRPPLPATDPPKSPKRMTNV